MTLGPADAVVAATLVVAMYTDVTTGKIKNWLTFPVAGAGILAAPLLGQPWWYGLAGAVAAFVPSFAAVAFKAFKAGDLKLLVAVGAWMGPKAALYATLFGIALNLPVGLIALALKGRLANLKKLVRNEAFEPTRMVYGVVLAVGVVMARWWTG